MNETTFKNKKLIKGAALGFATIIGASAFPALQGITSKAAVGDLENPVLYIEEAGNLEIETGSKFIIPKAYFKDTDDTENIDGTDGNGSSEEKIQVLYNGSAIETFDSSSVINYGTSGFTAKYSGRYTIVYSAKVDGNVYTKKLFIQATTSKVKVELQEDNQNIVPTIYDPEYSKAKVDGTLRDVVLPSIKVFDEENDEISGVKVYKDSADVQTTDTNYIIVSVKGTKDTTTGSITVDQNTGVVTIGSNNFAGEHFLKDGQVAVTYNYYEKNNGEATTLAKYINQTVKTFKIDSGYYAEDYKLEADLSSRPTFETGVAKKLPTVEAVATFTDESIDQEIEDKVNVISSVEVYQEDDKNDYVKMTDQSVIEDGEFTAPENGNYEFKFTVEDFYGNTVQLDRPYKTEAEDTLKPDVFVYDASNAKNYVDGDLSKELVDADQLLDAQKYLRDKTNAKNVFIYAVAGTDNAVKDLFLSREIDFINKNEEVELEAKFNKYNLVFNFDEATATDAMKSNKTLKVVHDIADLEESVRNALTSETNSGAAGYDVSALQDELIEDGFAFLPGFEIEEDVDFKIIYKARESEDGRSSNAISHEFEVVSDALVDNEKPEINFATNLHLSYNSTETVVFEEPTATDNTDDDIDVDVYYQLDGTGEEILLEKVDGKYELNLAKIITTETSVKIICKTTDDYGNSETLEKTFEIKNIADTQMPQIVSQGAVSATVNQNTTVTLPTISYTDDYLAYMNYNVDVYQIEDKDGTVLEDPRNIGANMFGAIINRGIYTLEGINFFAASAGKYQAVVSVEDAAKNIVSTYYFFTVNQVNQEELTISPLVSMTENDVKTGEELRFEAPILTTPLSSTQKVYGVADDKQTLTNSNYYYKYDNAQDVDKIGPDTFKFKEAGTYRFARVSEIDLYKDNGTNSLKADEDGVYKEVASVKYYAHLADSANQWKSLAGTTTTVTLDTNEYEHIKLISDEVQITVAESEATSPKFHFNTEPYNEITAEAKGFELTLIDVGVTGTDLDQDLNLDLEKSKISITSKKTGNTKNITFEEYYQSDDNKKYTFSNDGEYTIKYSIYAEGIDGMLSEVDGKSSFVIKVGDSETPTVRFKNILEENYTINEKIKIDLSKIELKDNKTDITDLEDARIITLERQNEDGTWETVENIHGESKEKYEFNLNIVGEYKLTVEVKDGAGWEGSNTFNFTVETKAEKPGISNSAVGIILIVISSLILVGVIAYFVLSSLNAKGKLGKKKSKDKKDLEV